jgi:hypothetical protein
VPEPVISWLACVVVTPSAHAARPLSQQAHPAKSSGAHSQHAASFEAYSNTHHRQLISLVFTSPWRACDMLINRQTARLTARNERQQYAQLQSLHHTSHTHITPPACATEASIALLPISGHMQLPASDDQHCRGGCTVHVRPSQHTSFCRVVQRISAASHHHSPPPPPALPALLLSVPVEGLRATEHRCRSFALFIYLVSTACVCH